MSQDKEDPFFNRSLERALQILNSFDVGRSALTLAQLSTSLNLPRATVLRLCSTLVKYDFLRQEPKSKQYSLGVKLLELGSRAFHSFTLRRIALLLAGRLQVKLDDSLLLRFLENKELLKMKEGDEGEDGIMVMGGGGVGVGMNGGNDGDRPGEVSGGPPGNTKPDERICGYVVLRAGRSLDFEETVSFFREGLPVKSGTE